MNDRKSRKEAADCKTAVTVPSNITAGKAVLNQFRTVTPKCQQSTTPPTKYQQK